MFIYISNCECFYCTRRKYISLFSLEYFQTFKPQGLLLQNKTLITRDLISKALSIEKHFKNFFFFLPIMLLYHENETIEYEDFPTELLNQNYISILNVD